MSEKENFCRKLQAAVKDENMAVGEYEALALEALQVADPQLPRGIVTTFISTMNAQEDVEFSELRRKPREAVSILLEKIRDDEKSHKEALEKIHRLVCPITPQ